MRGGLRIAPGLIEARTLVEELGDFRAHITASGGTTLRWDFDAEAIGCKHFA
jgi:hypothetical protein